MLQSTIITDLVNWIENHLEEPLNVKRVASKAGYSQWHLQRLFKYFTGDSLALFIRKKRLQCAAMDLTHSKRTIADIAFQYQFDSQQSFTRAFKKMFSQTPTDYRQQR